MTSKKPTKKSRRGRPLLGDRKLTPAERHARHRRIQQWRRDEYERAIWKILRKNTYWYTEWKAFEFPCFLLDHLQYVQKIRSLTPDED